MDQQVVRPAVAAWAVLPVWPGSAAVRAGERTSLKDESVDHLLLHVDLVRELPEAMKARVIPIASSRKLLEVEPILAA